MTIEEKISAFAPQFELMPGIVVVHQIEKYHPIYMTRNGLETLGISHEELLAIGEDYFKEFFNDDFTAEFFQKLVPLLKKENEEETFTVFHQVQSSLNNKFEWFVSSVRIFHSINDEPTHTLSISFPIEKLEKIPIIAEKLLAENEFSREHCDLFSTLTAREKEILKFCAQGKSSRQISELLNISTETVNSHKKSIRLKLNISSIHEMSKYANAFDLL